MNTQLRINVGEEFFTDAAKQILTSKVTQLVRENVSNEFTQIKIDESIDKAIVSLSGKVLKGCVNGSLGGYFNVRYSNIYPTEKFERLVDRLVNEKLPNMIDSILTTDFIENAVNSAIKEYVINSFDLKLITKNVVQEKVNSIIYDKIQDLFKSDN